MAVQVDDALLLDNALGKGNMLSTELFQCYVTPGLLLNGIEMNCYLRGNGMIFPGIFKEEDEHWHSCDVLIQASRGQVT